MTLPRNEPRAHSLEEIARHIREARSFLVIPHMSIDGDDLGSMVALKRGLEKAGKTVTLLCHEKIPFIYRFLPLVDMILNAPPDGHFDCALMMECTNLSRLPEGFDVKRHAGMVINIDHHPGNTMYGDMNYVDCTAAAVGEIVFDLLHLLNIPLDEQIAMALYLAILADTGSFQFSNTSSKTHCIAAELMKHGVKVDEMARAVFRNSSFRALKLKGEVIQTMEQGAGGRVTWCCLTRDMMERHGVQEEDMTQLIEDLNVVRDGEVFVLFKELKDATIRVSLRAWHVPVNRVAVKYNGGGHALAAGCTLAGSLDEVTQVILHDIQEMLLQPC